MSRYYAKVKWQPDLWPVHYKLEMWAWILHRLTGLYLIAFGILHLTDIGLAATSKDAYDWLSARQYSWWMQLFDLGLMTALFYHSLNGLRLILLDLGIGLRRHKVLFLVVMAAGFGVYVVVAKDIIPYIIGRSLF